jgi:hypothetical protein
VAARVARDVTALEHRARAAGKKLPTLTLHTTARFASAADQHAFAQDLSEAVTRLVAKYHDERAERGRTFTVVAAAYPALPPEENVP